MRPQRTMNMCLQKHLQKTLGVPLPRRQWLGCCSLGEGAAMDSSGSLSNGIQAKTAHSHTPWPSGKQWYTYRAEADSKVFAPAAAVSALTRCARLHCGSHCGWLAVHFWKQLQAASRCGVLSAYY